MGTNVLLKWTKVYKTHLFHRHKVTYSTLYAVLGGFRSYTQTELICVCTSRKQQAFQTLTTGISNTNNGQSKH